MISIYYTDGSVQGIRPSEHLFEYSSQNVKLLVDTIAQGRAYDYYVDGFRTKKDNKTNK